MDKPLSSDEFYYELNEAVNHFVLTQLNNTVTEAQASVLDAMHALLWNYCNTVNE